NEITYTDSLELVINIINNMIDIITYGLIAFTSISLVVSSVMIGVITYVSVVERTKEIGVLRSLGARKRDVSNLFMAETFIIGLLAGVFGVAVTYLISIPANIILGGLTGIYTLVSLPIWQAGIMIVISFLLTMISGLFPARAAANKDPVIALRTE
ncbi:MAG: FtsX-like permease family protein, partial [Clostridia bacterium]|nr:FtsX-like permease family protein [Clostridia bacterium]